MLGSLQLRAEMFSDFTVVKADVMKSRSSLVRSGASLDTTSARTRWVVSMQAMETMRTEDTLKWTWDKASPVRTCTTSQ
jgi:hypothetical protein